MAEAQSNRTYKWESLKSMPTKRVFSTACVHTGNIYVFGGCDAKGQPLDCAEVYLSDKRQWKVLASMPTKKAGCTVVLIDDKFYTLGGVSQDQTPLDRLEVYSVKDKTWQVLDSLPECLLGISAVARGDKIYAVGGMAKDTNPKDYFLCFDIHSGKWKSLPPIPTARYATFTFLIDDKLYVIGGRQGRLPVSSFEAYDFDENSWQELPDVPSKRVFAMYTYGDGKIFSVGGLKQPAKDGFANCCEVYYINKNIWVDGKNMPTARGDFAIGYIGDQVVCAGGLGNQSSPLSAVECYTPASDTWCTAADVPSTHCSCAYTVLNKRLHVIGGLSKTGPSSCMEAVSCCEPSNATAHSR